MLNNLLPPPPAFPASAKNDLNSMWEGVPILKRTIEAGYLPKEEKLPFIKKASDKFDILKVFIRLLRELNIIDQKKYLALQTIIQEIGRMFGGWMKSLPQNHL
ncbi:MAG: hypothetical protein US58_C0005G0071 [Candidatus Magasanikbacteria bacterium GW2011_GWA2_37_8]|uniref:bAvd-like domain-containing protein n=1 Tax=Candidatus Magasanikbacteria bacterium GW2011_GWA2_37_8 TaxID=1619036 RepID=A0A0G0KKP7_9BACT|nr:MAG: hypothetical protein US58_C0005G0071 [Candidatus Magasanikbacteria bacterium GW2011_GWA2_37_8]